MATCPECKTREGMVIEETDDKVLVAKPLGTWSLAGAQLKTSAIECPVILISHPRCNGFWRCFIAPDGYAYPVKESTE